MKASWASAISLPTTCAMIDWSADEGWHDARIVPFGPIFPCIPPPPCLHYGAEVFEGLKAYRRADGRIQLFRPDQNARRMIDSAERLCLPQLPEEDFLQILKAFVALEAGLGAAQRGYLAVSASLHLRLR